MIHLHARRENGERAFSRERFQQLTTAVRAATDDIVIQHSTGETGVPIEKRLESLRMLVERTQQIAELLGQPITTPTEAREILEI